MTISYLIKNLDLYNRNKLWLSADLPLGLKATYYFHIVISYIRLLTVKKKVITYLGNQFNYDNPATPLALQYYPYELKQKIIDNMSGEIKHILDIGGNLGHFSITANYYLPNAKIDIFEPNPEVFGALRKNVEAIQGVRAFNLAVASKKDSSFYFEPDRTGTGSFIETNASENTEKIIEIKVKGTNDVTRETRRSQYDLVKVDVEGYEFEVIKLLKNIKLSFLFIELSGSGRTQARTHSELFSLLQKQWGNFDIVYDSGGSSGSNTIDILIGFKS